MEVYRKIAVAKSAEDIKQVETELADMYGPAPDEVKLLLELATLRVAAAKRGVKSVVTAGNNLIFNFARNAEININELFAGTKGKVDVVEPTTVYLRLGKNYFEPDTLMMTLRKILIRE
jgi:transcription-repair coupling factor (superfamily II helicase)